MNVLEVKNLYVNFGENVVLEDINITIAEKEFLGIIGPNGGGKTTFLNTILGIIKPAKGTVRIFNKPVNEARKYIGYVPQFSSFEINYPISVINVVMMGRLGLKGLLKKTTGNDSEIAEEALEKVNLLHFKNRLIGDLSGGEKQRVLIARALATKPKLLILDEPTASIDHSTGKLFYDILGQLNEDITIILVSHDIGAVSRFVKKIACLNKTLVFHNSKEVTNEMIEHTYHCPVDLIAHGVAHRVLDKHEAGNIL